MSVVTESAAPETTAQETLSPANSQSTFTISLVTILALLLAWVLATHFRLASPLFLPSPADVLTQALAVVSDGYANGTLLDHILASLGRIGAAMAFGIVLGVPTGLLMGVNRWVKGILTVPIDIYWGLPPLAYLPLLIIWLGIGETSKILLLRKRRRFTAAEFGDWV
ncbi:MAG: hypothetical protein QM636_05705 [Rhizobium sp.]